MPPQLHGGLSSCGLQWVWGQGPLSLVWSDGITKTPQILKKVSKKEKVVETGTLKTVLNAYP